MALHLGQPDWHWELHDASSVRTPSPLKNDDLTSGDTRHLAERARESQPLRTPRLAHGLASDIQTHLQ